MINIEEGKHYRAKNGAVFMNAKKSEISHFALKIPGMYGFYGNPATTNFMDNGLHYPELSDNCGLNLVEEIEWYDIPGVFDKPVLCHGNGAMFITSKDMAIFCGAIPLTSAEIDALKSPYF